MKKITPLDRQSLFDVAMQTSGSIEASFDIAAKNNISITNTLSLEEEIDTVPVSDKVTFRFLSARAITPATEITDKDIDNMDIRGIEFMEVETNFFVN